MMIGWFPIGTAPFGVGPEFPMAVANSHTSAEVILQARAFNPVVAMLEDMTRPAVHALSLKAWDKEAEAEVTLYFADREFQTALDDDPADVRFQRGLESVSWSRSMIRPQGFGGLVRGQGEFVLENEDGRFDDIREKYAFDGRNFEVRFGREGMAYKDMLVIWTGKVFDLVGAREIRFKISDKTADLDVPLQPFEYFPDPSSSTSLRILEGGQDIYLKRKPMMIGLVRNFAPTLVNAQRRIYQLNASFVRNAWQFQVFLNGAQQKLDPGMTHDPDLFISTAPSAGNYSILWVEATGQIYIRVGTVPSNQIVTCAARIRRGWGPFIGPVDTTKASAIVDAAVQSEMALSWPEDFDTGAFTRHNEQQPWPIGLYYDENSDVTVGEAIDRLCGEASFAGYTSDGKLTVGVVTDDLPAPVIHLDDTNILEIDVERLPNGLSPSVYVWKTGFWRNYADMTGRIAGVLDPDPATSNMWKEFFAADIRIGGAYDSAIRDLHPDAQERTTLDDMFADATNPHVAANEEGLRLLDLYDPDRPDAKTVYSVTTTKLGIIAPFGTAVNIKHRRFGLEGGKVGIVVDDSYNSAATHGSYRGTTTLKVFA